MYFLKEQIYHNYIYLFRQRKNIVHCNSEMAPHVLLMFPVSSQRDGHKHTQHRNCDYTNLFLSKKDWSTKICSSYSNHGHCTLGKSCNLSHDIDLVVLSKEVDVSKNDRKRKRSPTEQRKNCQLSQQQDLDQQPTVVENSTRDIILMIT